MIRLPLTPAPPKRRIAAVACPYHSRRLLAPEVGCINLLGSVATERRQVVRIYGLFRWLQLEPSGKVRGHLLTA